MPSSMCGELLRVVEWDGLLHFPTGCLVRLGACFICRGRLRRNRPADAAADAVGRAARQARVREAVAKPRRERRGVFHRDGVEQCVCGADGGPRVAQARRELLVHQLASILGASQR